MYVSGVGNDQDHKFNIKLNRKLRWTIKNFKICGYNKNYFKDKMNITRETINVVWFKRDLRSRTTELSLITKQNIPTLLHVKNP
jgi:hypothetical protein